ncbi:YihY/virulence factor BrkB family protein [Myxosarcina sp. GI1(2024)]
MSIWIRFVRHLNWITLQKTIASVIEKRLTGLSAEMAYHAMLGLFPAIIATLTAIGLFETSVETKLRYLTIYFADIIPRQVWNLLLEFIREIKHSEGTSWFSLSSIAAIWIISGVLSAAINALDQIHQVPPANRRSFWQARLLAILLTLCTIALLIVAGFLLWIGDFLLQIALQQSWNRLLLITWKIFSAILILTIFTITVCSIYQLQTKLSRKREQVRANLINGIILISSLLMHLVYSGYLAVQNIIIDSNLKFNLSLVSIYIWRLLGFPIALAVVATAFGLIYRFGASYRTPNIPIVPGATIAAISWAIVSLLFRIYVTHIGGYNKIYGAVGTVVVLMLWLYLSSLVMLLGEQLNVIVGKTMLEDCRDREFDI